VAGLLLLLLRLFPLPGLLTLVVLARARWQALVRLRLLRLLLLLHGLLLRTHCSTFRAA